jgi:hypothetical protein
VGAEIPRFVPGRHDRAGVEVDGETQYAHSSFLPFRKRLDRGFLSTCQSVRPFYIRSSPTFEGSWRLERFRGRAEPDVAPAALRPQRGRAGMAPCLLLFS